MGKIIGKIFKFLLILLILALLGAFGFWLVMFKGWPWWFAAALVAGIIGIWIGFIFVKKYLLRSRERRFVQRVIDQDTAAIERAPVSQRHELLELQEHWKESVKRLQRSRLRKRGNPLYALPWFLIMGESRTGKTSAVKNAQQSTPMSEISRSSGLSGTRNCDWWFFDQAILLDTAGRYTIPIDEGPDLEEWKQFLILLSKYRKREPLNGVIVAISADKLLAADEIDLREEGQSIRQRVDQMMRTVGAKFPVYVLITKMDLVHGFTEFNQQLPEGSVAQAMGFTNTAFKIYWRDVMEDAVRSISRSLKNLRFLLVHQNSDPAPGAILFPNEFESMLPGMQIFLDAVFEENPYQETLLFRGLFFSSALRKGAPVSEFLTVTGVHPEADTEKDDDTGFYLKDFFAGILPKDRNLFTPLHEFVIWRRVTRSLGLTAWLLITLGVCGLLSLSLYHNYAAIRGFTEDFQALPKLTDDRPTNLLMLDKMRLEILEMEEANRHWIFPRFGLSQSIHVVDHLKKEYMRLFQNGFLEPLEDRLTRNISRVNKDIPDDVFVDYVGYVVAQIGVLEAHLAGKQLPMKGEFRDIAADILTARDRKLLPEIAIKFGNIYFAYLTWSKDKAETVQRLAGFRLALVQLIEKRGKDLRWLVQKWIPGVRDLHLNDFWSAAAIGPVKDEVVVPGAFTRQGRQHVEQFIAYIEAAFGIKKGKLAAVKKKIEKEVQHAETSRSSARNGLRSVSETEKERIQQLFERRKTDFWIWYRQEFYRVWYLFIQRFGEGEKRIQTSAGWSRMATLMTTDENPYFELLERVADEIEALHPTQDAPKWSLMLEQLNRVRALAADQKEKKGSTKANLIVETEKLKKRFEEKVDKTKARALEDQIKQAGAWNDYVDSLQKIQLNVSSRKQCFDTYASAFSFAAPQQGKGQVSPFSAAYSNYYKLKTMMTDRTVFPVVWDLVFGPQDFLLSFAAEQAACYLQEQWQEQVLSYLKGVDPGKLSNLLFEKNEGLVWKFLEGTAKPFLGRNETGFFARRDFRKNALPFSGELIHFLNEGTRGVIDYQPNYPVTFETLPLDVNDDSKVEPYSSVLQVNCADKKFVLENYNYPKKATFTWIPNTCGQVSLSISFPDIDLQWIYKGKLGFAKFIKDFRDGTRTFSATDFPEQTDHLKEIGVSWVKLSYKITGGDPVVQLLSRVPSKPPQKIVLCDFIED